MALGAFGVGCASLEKCIITSVTIKGQALEVYKKPRTSQEVADFLLWIYDEYVRLWEYKEFGWRKTRADGKLIVKIRRTWSWNTAWCCEKIVKTLGFGLRQVRCKDDSWPFPAVLLRVKELGGTRYPERRQRYDLSSFFSEDDFRRMVFERIPVYRLRIECLDKDGTVLASKEIPLNDNAEKAFKLRPSSCSFHFNHIREGELEFLPYGENGKWKNEIFPVEIKLPEGTSPDSVESVRCAIGKID